MLGLIRKSRRPAPGPQGPRGSPRTFLEQTRPGRRGPARPAPVPPRPPRRQPVRPRPPFRRDPDPGRLPPPGADPRLRRARAVHRPRPQGRHQRPVRPRHRSPDVRHSPRGRPNRPKTIPVTRESLRDYREGWTIWGILAFDDHFDMLADGLKPILQLASDWRERVTAHRASPAGAITGLTAHMQDPLVRVVYCMPPAAARGSRTSRPKYYVALRHSVHRDLGTDDRRQPEHAPGHRPARRPRESDPDPRPPPTAPSTPKLGPPRRRPRRDPPLDPLEAEGRRPPARSDRQPDRPAPAEGLLAGPQVHGQLDRRHDGGLPPRLPRVLRRSPRSATSA